MRPFALLLALAACSPVIDEDTDTDGIVDTDTDDAPVDAPDYTAPGPTSALTDTGSFAAGGGCTLEYTRYRPDGEQSDVLVLLVHGFARSQSQMAGWASHWASWGAEVVTPNMCALRPFNTDHPANGRHLAALAEQLADGRTVILAGHSAGALAAVLAAEDVQPAALLALDPVDADGLGAAAAAGITAPIAGLFGVPMDCNADRNGVAMLSPAPDATLYQIFDAGHCDFESPTDRICTSLCRAPEADRDAIERAVRALTASFIAWRGGLQPEAAQYWTPGERAHDDLSDWAGPL